MLPSPLLVSGLDLVPCSRTRSEVGVTAALRGCSRGSDFLFSGCSPLPHPECDSEGGSERSVLCRARQCGSPALVCEIFHSQPLSNSLGATLMPGFHPARTLGSTFSWMSPLRDTFIVKDKPTHECHKSFVCHKELKTFPDSKQTHVFRVGKSGMVTSRMTCSFFFKTKIITIGRRK